MGRRPVSEQGAWRMVGRSVGTTCTSAREVRSDDSHGVTPKAPHAGGSQPLPIPRHPSRIRSGASGHCRRITPTTAGGAPADRRVGVDLPLIDGDAGDAVRRDPTRTILCRFGQPHRSSQPPSIAADIPVCVRDFSHRPAIRSPSDFAEGELSIGGLQVRVLPEESPKYPAIGGLSLSGRHRPPPIFARLLPGPSQRRPTMPGPTPQTPQPALTSRRSPRSCCPLEIPPSRHVLSADLLAALLADHHLPALGLDAHGVHAGGLVGPVAYR